MLEMPPLNANVINEGNTCQIIFQTSLYASVISLEIEYYYWRIVSLLLKMLIGTIQIIEMV